MPFKHNKKRTHKFTKAKYKVTNWPKYNEALRQRGSITFWFNEESIKKWLEPRDNYCGRGRPKTYSDIAVQISLMIRQIYTLPLRQTEGFLLSVSKLMGLDLPIMDFSNLSKRSNGLKFQKLINEVEPGSHIIVDSTGLKVYGQDEWHQEKHNIKPRRTWRKLHICVDEKHQILACELTTPDVADATALPSLLAQVEKFDKFVGDGAYDGYDSYQQVQKHSPDAEIIVPPPKHAVLHTKNKLRDCHTQYIHKHGKIQWQKKTNYGIRSYAELAMQRYKQIIGNKLKARALPQQKSEAQASVRALNRMTQLGMPESVKVI
jgi:hypothetical protein